MPLGFNYSSRSNFEKVTLKSNMRSSCRPSCPNPVHLFQLQDGVPIFLLPLEIRSIIYELLFQTSCRDKIVTPDPEAKRRTLARNISIPRRHQTLNISHSLPFLRTCQQVHEEATRILYGNHTFWFDDIALGFKAYEHDVTKFCSTCSLGSTPPDEEGHCIHCCDKFWVPRDVHVCSHDSYPNDCDFMTMHRWLEDIGPSSRLKIRQLHLHFTTAQFTKSTEDEDEIPSGIYGELLAEALDMFSGCHNICVFGMSFEKLPDGCGRQGIWFPRRGIPMRSCRHFPIFCLLFHTFSEIYIYALRALFGIFPLSHLWNTSRYPVLHSTEVILT